ncbi:MAG: asparagine synthetase B [Calditrichaceae bacterium]|nr:asparagine synthetase B [Calditrichaceae bacterium]MBN2707748.1 asparagine synthetase B [Calditrichaceae bacterium]RQV96383.1 MAG: asparagine synthetase B [Calditrichota bacterium]
MKSIILIIFFLISFSSAQYLLIPMDLKQSDHLKAYGAAYYVLGKDVRVEWLLNYRGGSFLFTDTELFRNECRLRGVDFETISPSIVNSIYSEIEENNMEKIVLEKAPKIAVYSPPNYQPWDDAVTLVLTYAEIPYDVIYDREVLNGLLDKYDWLHLHHEDFTGQYGKFWAGFRNQDWYIKQQMESEKLASELGFRKVSQAKGAVAREIRRYTSKGGFLFAMCSATDALDIALAAENVDICASVFDGDPVDPDYQSKLDFSKTLAFENFKLIDDPAIYEFSDIDVPPSHLPRIRDPETDYFSLFEFSAKYDPVPTMLTQNHVNVVKGFMGQTTMFNRRTIKPSITIMGQIEGTDEIKYIHGNHGDGTFTFLGGHDPEDYTHRVGDPPTELELHKNSPGYRLILNNILFPAAKKKKLKT